MALVLSSVPVLVLCVRVMMLSLDPGRGCNGCSLQLALVLTGCPGDTSASPWSSGYALNPVSNVLASSLD